MRITAEVTGIGEDSTVPDNPGAVDAVIFADGEDVGDATLLPDPCNNSRLSTWGSCIDNWASNQLIDWIDTISQDGDEDERAWKIRNVVYAVQTAHEAA